MNKWIKAHKKKYSIVTYDLGTALEIGQEEAIPVSALEELFSKSGEQLAREMAEKVYPHHYLDRDNPKRDLDDLAKTEHKRKKFIRGFIEAHNLQQVKIASSMLNIDSLLSEFKSQGFNVDNWDGEQGAEKAIVDGVSVVVSELKKERDAYYDELHAKRIEVEELRDAVVKFQAELFEAVNNPNYENTQP